MPCRTQPPLRKAATLAAYQGAVAQATAPGHMTDDDKYAWAAYQRMFDANHRHMADAAAEAMARAYLRQGGR